MDINECGRGPCFGESKSVRCRDESQVGTTCIGSFIFDFSAAEELCNKSQLAQSFSEVVWPQPCTLQGEAKMVTFMLYHQHLWFAVGEAKGRRKRRRKKGWVVDGRCPVPSPGQTCGCSSQEESNLGGFTTPLSGRKRQLLFITGLPVITSLPMSKNCWRQLVVLGAEEIRWQGFSRSWYLPVLEKAGT